MSYVIPGGLPSLAHPIYGTPEQENANSEEGLFLAPFPEINLNNALGVTFPHLPWVAYNIDLIRAFDHEHPIFKLTILHEFCHTDTAHTPYGRLGKYEMFQFFDVLYKTFENEREQVKVPLIDNEWGSELKRYWEFVVDLKHASQLLEEVYAVRSSLWDAKCRNIISHGLRRDFTAYYSEKYGEKIPGFIRAYEAFDFVAGKIEVTAAIGLTCSALETLKPTKAFTDLLYYLCKSDPCNPNSALHWNLKEDQTELIKNLSLNEALDWFIGMLDELDPDDSLYKRRNLAGITAAIETRWKVYSRKAKDDFAKFLLNPSTTFLRSEYSRYTHRFSGQDRYGDFVIQGVSYGNFVIVLEAVRQQLSQGIGLLCPFWDYAPGTCCSRDNKEFLEKVWRCTSESSCKSWRRMGCLRKKGGYLVTRTSKYIRD